MTTFAVGPHLVTAVFRGPQLLWSWGPQDLPTPFWAAGFAPPLFSPAHLLSAGQPGHWSDLPGALT